ncbi:MAG: succinate dehydrogenase, hydrophobic membrane anchor protein [Luteibacter sp.]|uniref:succinate dehydrogenase, hydrophobic membrane anchor protein n=1 Tax=Luteibacter TaxID=242605 RepID=UPI0005603F27|nr:MULTISPECIES: succinate dehydrogenase, hydrophobic membrane anchor protein [unclassified Luteibacter]MDQ7994807.1 succinate dehydrogenase, hydrophobic membrane anchor protein [Luteibacter sp.]MDQ8049864.1 succinate dehydrogenase, hydrophobic membrane anchor protein [Luteibacter sp.]MDR6641339.1 succinate dehydrogenase / fumarate reductase membrane anchor subunit [Luteibacter sp. 1214]
MSKDLRNPLARARGLGSAKEGVSHWMLQRLTAVGLIFLTLWFVITVLSLIHADYATARASIARPWNAVMLIALIVTMFRHAVLGLQVVIEDYVHTRWLEVASLVAIKFIAVLAALSGVLAVLRIALGN